MVCWFGHERGYMLCLAIVFQILHRMGVSVSSAKSQPTAGTDHLGDDFPGFNERVAIVTSGSVHGPCSSRAGDSSLSKLLVVVSLA